MKKYIITFIFLLIFFRSTFLFSQSDTTDLRKNFQEEILLEDSKSEEEESKLLDFLNDLKRNPYDLNKITLEQLESIPFLNSILAKRIIAYRDEKKFLSSKRELLKVEGLSEDIYEKIKVYLIVKQSTKDILIDETGKKFTVQQIAARSNFKTNLQSRFLQELQPKKGYLSGKYKGTRAKFYSRFNLKFANLKYKLESNLTFEKDAGEINFADFASGFIELKDFDLIKDAVIGDYTITFAQGLALWNSQSFSKGIEAVTPLKKRNHDIDGYSSASETQYFRGGAVKLAFNDLGLNLFYSNNYYDASIDTTLNEIKSFYYDGYHRTSSEIDRRKSALEKLFGGRISYQHGSFRIGTTYWQSKFSKSIIPDSLKQLFNFSGTNAGMLGADYDFIFKNINMYGEFARSQSNSVASINALQITFYKFADLLFSYRNYPKEFAPVHSFGFGERNGDTYNERGFYSGISLRPFKGLVINSYFDQFEFPYRTFLNPVPTSGNDFLLNCEWRLARGLFINIKYKNENKEDSRSVSDEFGRSVKRIDNRNQLNARVGFIYQMTERFRLRSRFEYVNVKYKISGGNSKGSLFFSDIRIMPMRRLVFDMRLIFFDTGDYDSRLYEFENDIKGVMSNTVLYGKGRRWYIVAKYKPFPLLELSGKYAETYIDGAKSIGSGNDEIRGDVNNKLSLGLEMGF